MFILGAGMSGCIAGVMNQNATILEAGSGKTEHQALLRFRTPDIGKAVGIPFKEITAYKGIWHNDESVPLTPRAISLYSRKVSDKISYRSIIHQDKVTRWVAPVDFHSRLKEMCAKRIIFNADIKGKIQERKRCTIISTIPMNILAGIIAETIPDLSHNVSEIFVTKFVVPDCDVHMTYYYTDPTVKAYRASIEGDELIIESMWPISTDDVKVVVRSFGLTGMVLKETVDNHKQKNGKISPMNDDARKEFIVRATDEYNIYSLGRFATWRNLVLDDVYKDILKIKELIQKTKYDRIVK